MWHRGPGDAGQRGGCPHLALLPQKPQPHRPLQQGAHLLTCPQSSTFTYTSRPNCGHIFQYPRVTREADPLLP